MKIFGLVIRTRRADIARYGRAVELGEQIGRAVSVQEAFDLGLECGREIERHTNQLQQAARHPRRGGHLQVVGGAR
jgi:hypothetical protein